MTVEQQCEIARLMTGCKFSNDEISKNISCMSDLIKEEAGLVINRLLLRDNLYWNETDGKLGRSFRFDTRNSLKNLVMMIMAESLFLGFGLFKICLKYSI